MLIESTNLSAGKSFYTNKTRKTTMQNSKLSTGNQEKNLLEVKIALKVAEPNRW